MKPVFVFDEVHEHNFWISINMPLSDLEKWIRKHYKLPDFQFEPWCHDAEGLCFDVGNEKTGQGGTWIWMKGRRPKDPHWISVAAHECVHAAKSMMHRRGFDLGHHADEPMAYLVGFLLKKLLKAASRR